MSSLRRVSSAFGVWDRAVLVAAAVIVFSSPHRVLRSASPWVKARASPGLLENLQIASTSLLLKDLSVWHGAVTGACEGSAARF
ncbi:MAG TPA: hypothetical protein VHZ55_08065 [Bryobacteraceae bacterium]|nr:hypothetical protein [Bryobacteraceae bacterium]